MGRQMSLIVRPISWGTVLCLKISIASLMRRGYHWSMLVMSLASLQLIWWSSVWECLMIDDFSNSPFLPWALCSLILVGRSLPVSPMYTLPHWQGILYTPGLRCGSCRSLCEVSRSCSFSGAVWYTRIPSLWKIRWMWCEVFPK